jgi:hypothetical protein
MGLLCAHSVVGTWENQSTMVVWQALPDPLLTSALLERQSALQFIPSQPEPLRFRLPAQPRRAFAPSIEVKTSI